MDTGSSNSIKPGGRSSMIWNPYPYGAVLTYLKKQGGFQDGRTDFEAFGGKKLS